MKRKMEAKAKAWMYVHVYVYGMMMILAGVACGSATEQLSSRECEDLGFTGLALCSDCNTFADYVKDKGKGFLFFSFLFSDDSYP